MAAMTSSARRARATRDSDEETGDTTSDEQAEQLPDCIAGTTLAGSSLPPDPFGFEGDVVVCASGFGHTDQPLAIGWTQVDVQAVAAVHEVGGEVRVIHFGPGLEFAAGLAFTRLDAQGQPLDSLPLPVGPSHWLTGSATDDAGRLIVALESVDASEPNRVAMFDPSWTSVVWSVDVGSDSIGPIAPAGDEFLIGRVPVGAGSQVVRVLANGLAPDIVQTTLEKPLQGLAATPTGFIVSTSDQLEAYHADGSLAWTWGSTLYSIDALASSGEAAIVLGRADQQMSWVARIESEGILWSQVHERSELWHPLGAPDQPRHEQTQLMWLAALADGTFVAAGPQYVETPEPLTQTFVVHFDAEGHTLAQDRPFVDAIPYAIGGGSAAYVWMSGSFGSALRRYLP